MNAIHPNWRETDNDEQPVPIRSANTDTENKDETIEMNMRVSRSPAAVFGILLVASLGLTTVNNFSGLKGQIAGGSPLIHITSSGISPANITVALGDTIHWINEQDIPHILRSEDLCNTEGECLFTHTIFPGEQGEYTIPMGLSPGTYAYSSVTENSISGEIVVSTQVAVNPDNLPVQVDSPPVQPPPDIDPNPLSFYPPNSDPPIGNPTPSLPPPPPAPAQNIPTNPNTNSNLTANVQSNTQTLEVIKHKPFGQPETGAMTLWIVLSLSIVTLIWCTRHSFYWKA
ncbi:hypothetical protein KJ652_03390 [Patescibacteria group bacterium]|nr:hypothetical protein [Patescibacteria group bacterium]MBU1123609.1 hypothetical protein [Patescibacteria group bacterium]MBU1911896.1 hypothetical protein [Patescibacteria group bacterium]